MDGRREQRPRGVLNPAGWSRTSSGFNSPDAAMSTWRNIGDIEVVGRREWKEPRCRIAGINGAAVTLAQPCFDNANLQDFVSFNAVAWVENAYELLDVPGEWYLDRAAGDLLPVFWIVLSWKIPV